ncbi:uncharacterized protein LOC106712382 isoform X1 [Papilio machaon]|uniref:uncharacterized protein LOC106712382 isoform X1 n=1 Tax=Papilio machaon TaxID=76193 RepID=UPI001E665D41|nr:uncharacterized protein LOC106712382 isoform X1 [Papilio machaon]
MKSLLLFCFIACAYASLLPRVLDNGWEDYGPYEGLYKIGNISNNYLPLTKEDLRASKRGAQVLHNVKTFIETGFYTLPPLDPYYKDSLQPLVIADDKHLSLTAKLSHFNVTGLVAFTSDLLEIRYGNGRVDYRIAVPQVKINTIAHINLLVGRIFEFRADGVLSVLLNDVVVRGALQVVQVPRHGNRVYQLQGQHTRLHVGDVKAKFEPYLKGPGHKSSALGYGSDTWDDCLHLLLEHINEFLAKLVFHQANEILDGPTVNQINAYLLGADPTM